MSCSIKTILSAVAVLREDGKPIADVLEAAGIQERDLADHDFRISTAGAMRAWDASQKISGDPAFGLRAAEAIHPDTTALFAYLAASSDTPRDAFERTNRYLRIISESIEYRLETIGPNVVCSIHMSDVGTLEPYYADYVVAMMARLAGKIVADIEPLEIWFEHAEPEYVDEYARVIPIPVRFDSLRNGIAGGGSTMDQPLPGTDVILRTLLEEQAERTLAQLPERSCFADDVRNAIRHGLPRDEVSAEAVADALSMSPRTLRRRLAEADLSHRQLIDEVRCELASRALANAVPIHEVAFMVGFSDASAFHKAFRRWTGKSPGQFLDGL